MQPENQNIEYKERLNDKLEREIVGFLNSKLGGELYIGVTDDGIVVGIDNADALQLAVADRIKNNILPSCLGLFALCGSDIYVCRRIGKCGPKSGQKSGLTGGLTGGMKSGMKSGMKNYSELSFSLEQIVISLS